MKKTLVQENDSVKYCQKKKLPEKKLVKAKTLELNLCPVCLYIRMKRVNKGGYMCNKCKYTTQSIKFYENKTNKFKSHKKLKKENKSEK